MLVRPTQSAAVDVWRLRDPDAPRAADQEPARRHDIATAAGVVRGIVAAVAEEDASACGSGQGAIVLVGKAVDIRVDIDTANALLEPQDLQRLGIDHRVAPRPSAAIVGAARADIGWIDRTDDDVRRSRDSLGAGKVEVPDHGIDLRDARVAGNDLRHAGHTEGEENLARIVCVAVTREIGWLTVFGFSTENWVRPRAEVRHILGLHERLFGRVKELNELDVQVQWIGRPFDSPSARTPRYVQRAIRKAIADTASNTGMVLTVAFDYGGRSELVAAVEAARTSPEGITVDTIGEHLYLPELPPVDVLVRTSGEQRVSNFLLWQAAGAAIYFTEAPWPDFDAAELDAALALAR